MKLAELLSISTPTPISELTDEQIKERRRR